jgi:predicted transposase YdaD
LLTSKIPAEIRSEEEQSLMTALSQAYLEWEQRTEQRGVERGRQEGIEQGEKSLILRLLTRQLNGELPESARSQIDQLSRSQLESLAEALLDFSNLSDLETWLAVQEQ